MIAAQRPEAWCSSFRGRIVLQLPRSLLLLARLKLFCHEMDLLCRAAAMGAAGTLATTEVLPELGVYNNSRRDCAAAIRVGGAQEHRQLAAFGDCGSSRASAFTLGAGALGKQQCSCPACLPSRHRFRW